MENLSNTLLIVFVLAILGCDIRSNLECVSQNGEIFPLSTDEERSNANELCTCMQIRVFETAARGLADETKFNND